MDLDDPALVAACRAHAMTVTALPDHAGFGGPGEPIRLHITCSCGRLHMDGNAGEVMGIIQAQLNARGVPVSPWWPVRHPSHPLERSGA